MTIFNQFGPANDLSLSSLEELMTIFNQSGQSNDHLYQFRPANNHFKNQFRQANDYFDHLGLAKRLTIFNS